MRDWTLRDIQLQELEILEAFDKICKEANLQYFLVGGTLLGAMRHDGFIPWDDDVDVGMPIEDYRTLKKKVNLLLPSSLKYQADKSAGSYLGFAKICDGEFDVDIFPFVRMPNLPCSFVRCLFRLRHGCFWRIRRAKNAGCCVASITWQFAHLISVVIWKLLCVCFPFGGWHMCPEGGFAACAKKSQFVPFAKHAFEGLQLPVPFDSDAVLTSQYGNWRKLPPIDKRVPSHLK